MAHETDRWATLSPNQETLYRTQLNAARQLLHSDASREANVIPITASRFPMQLEPGNTHDAIMWPDPYGPGGNDVCMIITSGQMPNGSGSFVRVAESTGHFVAEGVVIGSSISSLPGMYGNQMISKTEIDPHHELFAAQVGADFFAKGIIEAQERKKSLVAPFTPFAAPQPHANILGIQGAVSSRLLHSLGSIGANLAYNGAVSEQAPYGGVSYNLAQALLKKAMYAALTAKNTENGHIVNDTHGRPSGVIFESDAYGLTVVRHAGLFPDAIAIATTARPPIGSDVTYVQQHTVRASFMTSDIMPLDAEAYNPPQLLSALGSIGNVAVNLLNGAPVPLDKEEVLRAEKKIIDLLTERSAVTI